MQILTYPVGIVVGLLPIVVDLGAPPRPADLRLDGRSVCALTGESPGCPVDLGPSPRVHLLELVRADPSGRVVERVLRWVNRPGADRAEVQTKTTCSEAGPCSVLIGWAHPEKRSPSRIRVSLDGKRVSQLQNRTLIVPSPTARGTLLVVELAFADGSRATYASTVGGRAHGDETSNLVPMLHDGACVDERRRTIVRRYEDAGLPVRAVEPGAPGQARPPAHRRQRERGHRDGDPEHRRHPARPGRRGRRRHRWAC